MSVTPILRVLHLGGSNNPQRLIMPPGSVGAKTVDVVIDMDPLCEPDILWNLNHKPWPIEDERFDEIHAYEVLEHLGSQGDYNAFFDDFREMWRILRPGGRLLGSTPQSFLWMWGDPSHTRTINHGTLSFVTKAFYFEYGNRPQFRPLVEPCWWEMESFEYKKANEADPESMRLWFMMRKMV